MPHSLLFLLLFLFLQLSTIIQSQHQRERERVIDVLFDNSTQKPNLELRRVRNFANQLTTNLLKNYDSKKPSHTPVILYTYMVIDHLKEFNEYDMTMQLQATFVINWQDKRLMWEPKDYGNLSKISIENYRIPRFWIPQIQAKAILPSKKTLIQASNTELLLTMNGAMFAAAKIQTPLACDTQLDNYPFDTPNCSLYVLCRNFGGQYNDVIFGNMHVLTDRNVFFNGNNGSQVKEMHILNFTSTRYYITNDGVKPMYSEEPNWSPPIDQRQAKRRITTMGSFIHYEIFFTRNVITYTSSVLLPLFIGTILMVTAALTDNQKIGISLMVLAIFFEYLTLTRISFSMPPNYVGTPFCMEYSGLLFVETIVIFIYKMIYTYMAQLWDGDKQKLHMLVLVQRFFKYFLIVQLVFCTVLLFLF